MRSRRGAAIGALMVVAVGALIASLPRSEPVDGVFMARGLHSYRDAGMLALLQGRLDVLGGCLVVTPTHPGIAPSVVIWAREFSLRRDGDRLSIFDGEKAVVAVEEHVGVGGGEVEDKYVAQYVRDQMPSECRRDKYFVGNEVQRPAQ